MLIEFGDTGFVVERDPLPRRNQDDTTIRVTINGRDRVVHRDDTTGAPFVVTREDDEIPIDAKPKGDSRNA
jgi:hypothetical protein